MIGVLGTQGAGKSALLGQFAGHPPPAFAKPVTVGNPNASAAAAAAADALGGGSGARGQSVRGSRDAGDVMSSVAASTSIPHAGVGRGGGKRVGAHVAGGGDRDRSARHHANSSAKVPSSPSPSAATVFGQPLFEVPRSIGKVGPSGGGSGGGGSGDNGVSDFDGGDGPTTLGVDIRVTPDRVILIDTPPILSPGMLLRLMRGEGAAVGMEDGTPAEALMEHLQIQLASFLLTVCHVVVVVGDGPEDVRAARFVTDAATFRPRLPSLAAIAEAIKNQRHIAASSTTAAAAAAADELAATDRDQGGGRLAPAPAVLTADGAVAEDGTRQLARVAFVQSRVPGWYQATHGMAGVREATRALAAAGGVDDNGVAQSSNGTSSGGIDGGGESGWSISAAAVASAGSLHGGEGHGKEAGAAAEERSGNSARGSQSGGTGGGRRGGASPSSSSAATIAAASSVPFFVLPEVELCSPDAGSAAAVAASFSSPSAYEEAIAGLRNGVFAMPRRTFGGGSGGGVGGPGSGGGVPVRFTERDWLLASERVWESMLYAPTLSDHHEVMQRTLFHGL